MSYFTVRNPQDQGALLSSFRLGEAYDHSTRVFCAIVCAEMQGEYVTVYLAGDRWTQNLVDQFRRTDRVPADFEPVRGHVDSALLETIMGRAQLHARAIDHANATRRSPEEVAAERDRNETGLRRNEEAVLAAEAAGEKL